MKRLLFIIPLVALFAANAAAGDPEFDTIVRRVESDLGIRRTHIPLFGLATLVVKAAEPGVKQLDLAIFEDLNYEPPAGARFDEIMRRATGGRWSSVIRVRSRRDHEWTYIYAKPDGEDWRILVANFEPREAVIVETRVTPEILLHSLDAPKTPKTRDSLRVSDFRK
jgi:hypothetical protein